MQPQRRAVCANKRVSETVLAVISELTPVSQHYSLGVCVMLILSSCLCHQTSLSRTSNPENPGVLLSLSRSP